MINLDLRDLTPELAATAVRDGKCKYRSPCIIGALMTPEQQSLCDSKGEVNIADLIAIGDVSLPEDQITLATSLQTVFDNVNLSFNYLYEDILEEVFALKESTTSD